MSVKLTTRHVGDVTVIDVAGRITLGEGSSALRDALRARFPAIGLPVLEREVVAFSMALFGVQVVEFCLG